MKPDSFTTYLGTVSMTTINLTPYISLSPTIVNIVDEFQSNTNLNFLTLSIH